MDYNNNQNWRMTPPPVPSQSAVTRQTNAVLKRVYVRMFIGMLITAFCALGVSTSPGALAFFIGNPFVYWGMFIAMLVMAIVIPARLTRMSTGTCLLLFCVFCALMGCSMASIFLVYSLGSITYTFFITAGVFGAVSVYGYFTKADLSRMGTYLVMALFGLFLVMIVNIFARSTTLEWIVSIVGVFLFIGLTAWDTQTVKQLAAANVDPAMADKLATMGALNLYLDFINLFLFILRIFGGSNNN